MNPDTRPVLLLAATIPAMGAAAVNSPGELVPLGFDLCGVQLNTESADYNGRTITLKLQGSCKPGDTVPASGDASWLDVNPACSNTFTADAVKRPAANEVAGCTPFGGYRWLRLVATPSGALAASPVVCEAWIVPAGAANTP